VRPGRGRPPDLTRDSGLGRLYAGTSGFAYPAWTPRFYPPGARPDQLLAFYSTRLPACELNNTFYARPTETKIRAWVAATPPEFRFAIKAQRGSSTRALVADPTGSVPWLTESLGTFGHRLGTVLFRVPSHIKVDVARLLALLAAWPPDIPLTFEFQDPSWHVDEVFTALTEFGAALCATELPDDPAPPTIRLTGRFLYLRLRRADYSSSEVEAWARRLVPFIASGRDAFVFFRHDETGRAAELATELRSAVEAAPA
jgi:uncharacterized protein YecE (DUF72 family)